MILLLIIIKKSTFVTITNTSVIGDEREYLSADSLDRSEVTDNNFYDVLTPEFLNSLHTSGLPNHKIKLKIGTPIMLLRNIDQTRGLCNGSRLIVTNLGQAVLGAKIMSGTHRGNVVFLHRMDMSPSQSPWPFKMNRRQFPIIVSYAMTINKSQGQSLDCVGLYLPKPVFSHGQLYVAISRVKAKKGLKILILDDQKKATNITTNVVYKEVFHNI
jgi:ATP-dependent DNA helicase PIF1